MNVLPPPLSDNMDAWLDMDSQYGLTDMEIISQDRSDPSIQDEYSSYTTSPAIHASVDLVNYWVVLVLGKFGPGPIGTRSEPDQTQWSRSRSGIFPKSLDRLVSGLDIPTLPETVSDPVWTGPRDLYKQYANTLFLIH